VLGNSNSYTGSTVVQAGTLRLNSNVFSSAADIYLMTGGILNLNFSGAAAVIDSLFINGIAQSSGIWGAVGSGAPFTTSLITGPGRLQVTTPLIGDYNNDHVVDASDYGVWRNSIGASTLTNRDPLNTGPIGQADYLSWRTNFGRTNTISGGGGEGEIAAVPEPTLSALLVCAMAAGMWPRQRRREN
jgi:hypothetical protein